LRPRIPVLPPSGRAERVIPLAVVVLALATPGLADGQGFMRARCAEPLNERQSHEGHSNTRRCLFPRDRQDHSIPRTRSETLAEALERRARGGADHAA